MRNALLSQNGKTLAMAAVQGSLDYPFLAKQMRQILHPVGGAHKEDVLNISADAGGAEDEDLSYEAWIGFRKAGRSRKDPPRGMRPRPRSKGSKPDEQVRNGFNRRTGERNRRCCCGGEYHLLPKCPKRTNAPPANPSPSPPRNYVPRSSFSSIAMDPASFVCSESSPPEARVEGCTEQSFSTSLDPGCQLVCMRDDSVVVLDTGATANLACFRWLSRRNSLLEQKGFPRVLTYPAQARFKFGDGRAGNVCFAADITAGIAGAKGAFTACGLDADIPALLRKGASAALAGQSDFARNTLTLGPRGIEIPLKVNAMGHYILSVADFPAALASLGAESHFLHLFWNGALLVNVRIWSMEVFVFH